jgi:hypothetical protein
LKTVPCPYRQYQAGAWIRVVHGFIFGHKSSRRTYTCIRLMIHNFSKKAAHYSPAHYPAGQSNLLKIIQCRSYRQVFLQKYLFCIQQQDKDRYRFTGSASSSSYLFCSSTAANTFSGRLQGSWGSGLDEVLFCCFIIFAGCQAAVIHV